MIKKIAAAVCAAVFVLSLVLAFTSRGFSAEPAPQDDAAFRFGSIILSIFYLPVKLVTCVGGQVGTGALYVLTYGVPGNFDGGTNGKELGDIAKRSCAGPWVIGAKQVKEDYE